MREGGTQNYKVVKNKKGKSFIFLVVPSLRPMMIRLGTGPPSGRIRVPVDTDMSCWILAIFGFYGHPTQTATHTKFKVQQ